MFKSSFVNNALESLEQALSGRGNKFTNYIYASTYFKVSNFTSDSSDTFQR